MSRIRDFFGCLFTERQFFFRSSKEVRFLHLSTKMQACLALATFVLIAWTILGSYGLLTKRHSFEDYENLRLREQLRTTIAAFENRFTRLRNSSSNEIEELTKSYSNQLEELNRSYSNQLEELNDSYSSQIDELNDSHRRQIDELNDSYENLYVRFNNLRNRFFDTVDALETRQQRLRTALDRYQVLQSAFDGQAAKQTARLVESSPESSNRLLASKGSLSRPLMQSRITPFSVEITDDGFFRRFADLRGALQKLYPQTMRKMQENMLEVDYWVQEMGGVSDSELARLSIEHSHLISVLEEWIEEDISRMEDILSIAGLPFPIAQAAGKTVWQDSDEEHGTGGPLLAAGDDARSDQASVGGYPPGSERQFSRIALDLENLGHLREVILDLPLILPLDEEEFRLSSGFGFRIDPVSGQRAFHAGMDFSTRYKSPALATAPGVVSLVGWSGPYGRIVDIDHGNGIITRYGHLAEFLVEQGQEVAARQPIGLIGSSGRSTGTHLHYEIRVDGRALDPWYFIKAGHYAFSQR